MLIRKLKGAAQMVANMLERDTLPARTEAAKELKDLVAETESHIARQGQELTKRAVRISDLTKHLETLTKHWEDEIAAFGEGNADKKMLKDVKAARAYLKSRAEKETT